MSEENKTTIKKAVGLNFLAKYSVVAIQLIYNAIMARILLPKEFGVVAILSVFTNYFTMIADFGIGNALIQKLDIEDKDIDTAFVFATGIGIVLAGVFSALSKPISIFYTNSEYVKMVPILSIAVLFNTMSNIPAALLLKQKKFKIVAIRQIIINIIACVIAVFLAKIGWSYYSLVLYSVVTAFANFLWNFFSCGHRFKVRFYKTSLKKIIGFSVNLMMYNIINYAAKSLDRLILGKTMTEADVGNYNKSVQLTAYPINYLSLVITPTILPFLASHQEDKAYVYDRYLKLTKFLSIIGVAIAIYLSLSSKEIITIMYGENWGEAIRCFKWHALAIWPQMIAGSNSSIYQVLGKTKNLFRLSIIIIISSAVAIIIGLKVGTMETVAFSIMIVQFFIWIFMSFELSNIMEVKWMKLLKNYIPDFILAVLLFAIMSIFNYIFSVPSAILSALLKGIITMVIFVGYLVISKEDRWIINALPERIKSKVERIYRDKYE